MIANGRRLTHLKMLKVADLFERSMILLNLPMLVMEFEERETIERNPVLGVRSVPGIMAWLVF